MLKLKLQYFGHLIRRADSLEKTLMLGKIEGRRGGGQQRMRGLAGITDLMDVDLSKLLVIVEDREPGLRSPPGRKGLDMVKRLSDSNLGLLSYAPNPLNLVNTLEAFSPLCQPVIVSSENKQSWYYFYFEWN